MNDAREPYLEDLGPESAGELRRSLVADAMIDGVIAAAGDRGVALTGKGGLQLILVKAMLERGLAVELDNHLG